MKTLLNIIINYVIGYIFGHYIGVIFAFAMFAALVKACIF